MNLLRYPGTKAKIAAKLAKLLPSDVREYREPFLGSAVLLAAVWDYHESRGLPHPRYWGNDINQDVIGLYKAIQSNPRFVQRLLDVRKKCIPEADHLRDIQQLFEGYKHDFVYRNDPLAFWFLNRFAYGLLVRRDRKDVAPFGGVKRQFRIGVSQVTPECVCKAQRILKDVTLTCQEYRGLFLAPGSDVLIFADPPYYCGDEPSRAYMYEDSWNRKQHEEFLDVLVQCPHRFILTYGYSVFALSRLNTIKRFTAKVREVRYTGVLGGSRIVKELQVQNF